MKKTNKGITLIALIVTIIVLIILAGVAIAMLRGDNGIATKSTTAKSKNSESTATERMNLAYSAVKSEIETQLTDNASYDALEDSNFLKLVNIVREDFGMTEIALLNDTAVDEKWTVTPGGSSTDTERTIKITYTDSSIQENEGKVEKTIKVMKQSAILVQTNGTTNYAIVDGDGTDGKHYHNDVLFTGYCEKEQKAYVNGIVDANIIGCIKTATVNNTEDADDFTNAGSYGTIERTASTNSSTGTLTNGDFIYKGDTIEINNIVGGTKGYVCVSMVEHTALNNTIVIQSSQSADVITVKTGAIEVYGTVNNINFKNKNNVAMVYNNVGKITIPSTLTSEMTGYYDFFISLNQVAQ